MLDDWAYAVPYRSQPTGAASCRSGCTTTTTSVLMGSLAGLPPAPRLPAQVNNLAAMHS
jgi:hypothetical protein